MYMNFHYVLNFFTEAKKIIFTNNHITWNAYLLPTDSFVAISILTRFFISLITLCGVENHFFFLVLIQHPWWEQIPFNVTGVVSLCGVKDRVFAFKSSRIAFTKFLTSVFDDWFSAVALYPCSFWSIDFELCFVKDVMKFCLGMCASAPKIYNNMCIIFSFNDKVYL